MKINKLRIIVILICVVIITIVSDFIFVNYQKQRPVEYLTEKYSANVDDFEFVDFKIRHFFIDMDRIKSGWQRSKWHYKYNDVIFTVEYDDEKKVYVDDYQLEEVFEWSVEYLQKNIDERIVGVDINTTYFYFDPFFEYVSKKDVDNKIIKKEDIPQILKERFIYGLRIYYCENISDENELNNDIKKKIDNHFNIDSHVSLYKKDTSAYHRKNSNIYYSPNKIIVGNEF